MGYVPLPPMPRSAGHFLAQSGERLERELRGRGSRFAWKRRRAYRACLTLIRAREAEMGLTGDPWKLVAPPKPERQARPTLVER